MNLAPSGAFLVNILFLFKYSLYICTNSGAMNEIAKNTYDFTKWESKEFSPEWLAFITKTLNDEHVDISAVEADEIKKCYEEFVGKDEIQKEQLPLTDEQMVVIAQFGCRALCEGIKLGMQHAAADMVKADQEKKNIATHVAFKYILDKTAPES